MTPLANPNSSYDIIQNTKIKTHFRVSTPWSYTIKYNTLKNGVHKYTNAHWTKSSIAMNWRITVTWTILLLSENFGSTYSCQCPCNSTASNYSTNGTTTISISDTANTTVNSKGTSGPSTTTAYISSDTTTITSTTIHISTKSQSKTTSATNIQTTTCTNTF